VGNHPPDLTAQSLITRRIDLPLESKHRKRRFNCEHSNYFRGLWISIFESNGQGKKVLDVRSWGQSG